MPTVSVIVPNYNHAPYLEKRIVSVLNQTYQDFELIILDDKSTDGSAEVIDRYRTHPKVTRIVVNEVNGGSTFRQWNKGVALASGEYVWIAESDDYADARFLETLVKKAREHLAAGIVYCESWAIDAQGNLLYKVSHYEVAPDRWARDFYNAGRDECARYLVLHNIIPNASAVLFRREVYLKAGPADESMRLAGDWLQWARMLLIADIAYVAQPLNYYRTHTTSVRSKSAVLVTEVVECHQVILAIAEAVPVSGQALLTGSGIILDRWMSRIKADPTRTVKDYYQALAEITARVALPKPSGDRVREWMLKEWVGQITAGKTSFKQLAGTYTMARKSDATILKKLLKRLLKHYYPGIYRAIVPTA